MRVPNMINGKTLLSIILPVLGLFVVWLIGTNDLVAQNEHNGHAHDERAADQDEHEDHDRHTNEHEDVVKFSNADMRKFGIEVATAGRGYLPVHLSLPAEVALNEDRIAHVTPRVPGVVRAVIKTLGDRVHVGEIMAVLDSLKMGEAQIAYLDTRTALEIATANIDLALTKLEVA